MFSQSLPMDPFTSYGPSILLYAAFLTKSLFLQKNFYLFICYVKFLPFISNTDLPIFIIPKPITSIHIVIFEEKKNYLIKMTNTFWKNI